MNRTLVYALSISAVCGAAPWLLAGEPAIDFSRDIRPLLSDKCFACHGPSEEDRQGGFRLDVHESALGETDSGEHAIVPGDPDASAMYQRISSNDPDVRMPPEEANKTLTPAEIERVRAWIEQGAPWQVHWSLIPPQRPEVPSVAASDSVAGPIDAFIVARLESAGLAPSPPADRRTLIRRVTLDLTGLPPTLEEVDAFLADDSAGAYERLVDRLLASPHYGEHMARFWLDAARYGDTHGLHLDNYREMWPYRDWVVRAFNENMPYDEFTIEQLAGDLLPNPTLDQLIATGFNRCHVTTNEGGSIAEEVYVRNVVDRVVTTGTVFLGMTFDCTRCHNHKYDPFTMKDFYSMFGYFNSIDGEAMDGNSAQPPPVVKVPSEEQSQQIADLQGQIAGLKQEIASAVAAVAYDESADAVSTEEPIRDSYVWIDDDLPADAKTYSDGTLTGQWDFVARPAPVFSGTRSWRRTAEGSAQQYIHQAARGLRVGRDDKLFAFVYLDAEHPPRELMLQWNTGEWKHRAYWGENLIEWGSDGTGERLPMGPLPKTGRWVRLEVDAADVGLAPGAVITGWAFTQFDGTVHWDMAGLVTAMPQGDAAVTALADWVRSIRATSADGLPDDVKAIIELARGDRGEAQQRRLRDYFVENVYAPCRDAFAPLHERLKQAETQLAEAEKSVPTTLVFRERAEPRPAFILNRGEYDQRREQVERAVPASLPPLPEGAPNNRLGLARWLVDPGHPLASRVAVNRFWQQFFGTGIVKTAEDFGSQGEPPSHPQLLDWLAVDFIESGWDVKALVKKLAMTNTYRQSSRVTPELHESDPANRLLTRGPRYRLDAEMLRDQALAVSGLLREQLGGPSVKPPQPDGLWFAVGYSGSNTVRFKQDEGPDKVYRRTLYTFLKRTAPPPEMSTFDAPSREACTVRRERTNTPLQALLLMNDPQYVEAARALAERTMREGGSEVESRAAYMYQLCAARRPDETELVELVGLFNDQLARYEGDPQAAGELIAVGETPPDANLDAAQLAAWTTVANVVLNLDAVLTKS